MASRCLPKHVQDFRAPQTAIPDVGMRPPEQRDECGRFRFEGPHENALASCLGVGKFGHAPRTSEYLLTESITGFRQLCTLVLNVSKAQGSGGLK